MTAFSVIAGLVVLAAVVFIVRRRLKADTVSTDAPTSGSPADPRTVPTKTEVR